MLGFFSSLKGLYDPKAFFIHAVWLRQSFLHCAIFSTAASRRSLGRISVPVWLDILSDQLPIAALVSFYLTNKLIGRRLISKRHQKAPLFLRTYAVLIRVSSGYSPLWGRFLRVTHPSAGRQQDSKLSPVTPRLACVKPTASVQSEPWSNSSINNNLSCWILTQLIDA